MAIRIIFMGSPDFAVPALQALTAHYSICGVITQPDRPSGRGMTLSPPPVKIAAQNMGLPVIQPEKLRSPEAFQQLVDWQPDLIVVAAFGQILRQNVLDLPKYGCINIHASLLPRHRGAAPIQAAILAGDRQTGITIMKMEAGLDTGPMLRQQAIPIEPEDTGGSLFEKLSELGAELLLQTLPGYLSGEILPHPQPEEGASYFGMIKKEDGLLDFTLPAADLERKIRAFSPWPGTYLQWQGGPLKILRAHVMDGKEAAGKHLVIEMLPAIAASNGLLVFDELQPAGKKPMSGKAFMSGARDWESI